MLAIILVAVILMILWKTRRPDWTVYGTMGCGWTRKQLDHMKSAGLPHVFVDCDKGGCPGSMDAFPTMVHRNGEKVVGFKKV